MSRVLFVALVLCVAGVFADKEYITNPNADPVESVFQVTVNNTARTFYLYVPSSYTGAALPLIVFFHGATDACTTADNFMISGFTKVQVARKFLLATPCGLNKVWTGPTDLPFAETILTTVAAKYSVDSARIYASGFSNGAGLTEYIGCRIPNKFTGGVAIAAGWVMGDSMSTTESNAELLTDCDTAFAKTGAKLNVIKLQGSVDPAVVPYGRTSVVSMRDDFYGWALRNGCKGSPTTVHEDAVYKDEQFENCPDDVYVRLVFLYGIPHQWVQNATFNYNNVILDQFGIVAPAAHRVHKH